MISERELARRYASIEIRNSEPNRVNTYTCDRCKYVLKTIDRHEGVTPMSLTCDCCGGTSISSFYQDKCPDKEPEKEWVVPTLEELKKYRANPAMLDHIFNGGLYLRKIKGWPGLPASMVCMDEVSEVTPEQYEAIASRISRK